MNQVFNSTSNTTVTTSFDIIHLRARIFTYNMIIRTKALKTLSEYNFATKREPVVKLYIIVIIPPPIYSTKWNFYKKGKYLLLCCFLIVHVIRS